MNILRRLQLSLPVTPRHFCQWICDWQDVIGKLSCSFKEKLTFVMQQEFLMVRSKYPVARVKPFSGKDKTPDVAKKSPVGRKVTFPVDDVRICINDLAKNYNVTTSLETCTTMCPYTHYKKLPAGNLL